MYVPPTIRYPPEKITAAALELARESGLPTVTARRVARVLGCSTAPVFTHFATMEELHEAVIDAIILEFVEATKSATHPDPLVGAGLGMLAFAAAEPMLYEALFLTRHPWHHKWGPVRQRLAEEMRNVPSYAALTDAARFALVGRASIIVHGLGVEIWSGRLTDTRPGTLLFLLEQLARPLIEATIQNGWTRDLHSAAIRHSRATQHNKERP